jgi:thiol-disulfide isomerase/thioredoxin
MPMPSFEGATKWLNSEFNLDEFNNHPIVVQFWAISCPICKWNMPAVHELIHEYSSYELRLISVHMPRITSDTDIAQVVTAAIDLGVSEPCAIDSSHSIGDRFQAGGAWPSYFLFDNNHQLRRHAAGINGLKLLEPSLKRIIDSQTTIV